MTIWTFIFNILAVNPYAPWAIYFKENDDTVRLSDEDDTYYGKLSMLIDVHQSLWTIVSRTI